MKKHLLVTAAASLLLVTGLHAQQPSAPRPAGAGPAARPANPAPRRAPATAISASLPLTYAAQPARLPGTIVVPASDFLDELGRGHTIADAASMNAPWVFNNTAVTMKTETNLLTRVQVPEPGVYYVYVRSAGDANTSFAVAIDDAVTGPEFGTGPLGWKRSEKTFELTAGRTDVKITRIKHPTTFDLVVLSTNPNLTADDLRPYQLNPDAKLIREYRVPNGNAVKFGDVTGDGKTDFLVLTPDFSAHMIDNAGKTLWIYESPAEYVRERSEFEAPGVLWDFDKDGRAEVVHWRFIDGQEWLVIADGRTGEVLRKTLWPTKPLPHVYNNFRLAIAKLTPGEPNQIVAFTDFGGGQNIQAFDSELDTIWSHDETRAKDNLGHYVYPIDLDGDGLDEVLLGSMLLDRHGKKVWDRFDLLPNNRDHADSYKFADLNGDKRLDIISSNSETGVIVYDAATGKVMWQNTAEHSQQLAVGNFLAGVPAPQVVIGGRTYGNRTIGEPYLSAQLFWFDKTGELLKKWPGQPLNGNPDFVLGNWRGDGKTELFWFKFHINDKGAGDLYFPDPVFHMFDFEGRGAEEVITLSGGVMRVWGSRSARYSGRDLKANLDYRKRAVVNHTHY